MGHRLLQMCLRGVSLMLMMVGMFYHSEFEDLTSSSHFLMSGVYGAFIVVTMGLLIEAALQLKADVMIESSFLISGIILNAACSMISFLEFEKSFEKEETHSSSFYLNKGFVSMLGATVYVADLMFSWYYVDR